jgi:hypothetical protein
VQVYIVFYCASVESGSGFEESQKIHGVFSSKEEAEKVSKEGNQAIFQRDLEFFGRPVFDSPFWYEVQEHEVR